MTERPIITVSQWGIWFTREQPSGAWSLTIGPWVIRRKAR